MNMMNMMNSFSFNAWALEMFRVSQLVGQVLKRLISMLIWRWVTLPSSWMLDCISLGEAGTSADGTLMPFWLRFFARGLLAQGHEGLLSTRLELRSVSTFDWLNLFWCALFCWGFNSRPVLQSSDMCSRFLPWLQALPGCFAGVRKSIFQRAEAICLH